MSYRRLLILAVFAVLLCGSFSYFYSARSGEPKEPSIYALVWLGEPIRLPSGEGKNRTEVLKFREEIFRDEVNVLRPALEDPAVAPFRGFRRDEKWLEGYLRVERLSEPEALRPVLARGQAVVRVWLADGTPEEQAAFVNAVVRAWDNKFFARQRGDGRVDRYEEWLKKEQKWLTDQLRKDEADLAALNRKPIPDDPLEQKSLEGQKRVTANFIREKQEAIRKTPKLIEEHRAAQLKIPLVLEWAKAP